MIFERAAQQDLHWSLPGGSTVACWSSGWGKYVTDSYKTATMILLSFSLLLNFRQLAIVNVVTKNYHFRAASQIIWLFASDVSHDLLGQLSVLQIIQNFNSLI